MEVIIGGECPNCTSKGDHWYHSGQNRNASSYREYVYNSVIYMPTNEQVRTNTEEGKETPWEDYGSVAAHELGHILGLADAYFEEVDRCADNSETGHKYDDNNNLYDNLMKYHVFSTKINANGIEMMLAAVDETTGIPSRGSQYFKTYGEHTISEVIKNTNDEQLETTYNY